ncbi:MAG: putative glycolipid-binding domain-containing protein [Acetobacteraceae bacterium]
MPIRTLSFGPGVAARLSAAYVPVFSLEVVQREQEYALISPGRFRYRNPESGFTAALEVDVEGLVERYGEIWRRT